MMRLRSSIRFYLVLLLALLLPAAVPTAAAQPAVAETWIAFTSLAPGEEGLWMIHPDGSGLGRLTEGRDLYPTWSPDGSLLAYVHEVSGTLLYGQINGYNSEIRVVDTAGQIRYTIGRDTWVEGEAATPLAGSVGLPQWSSDGQALSYGVDLEFFFIVAWGGRRTFYLSEPRIEVGRGPQGGLQAGGTVMLDQSWAPGPVPTWVRSAADLTSCQVMAYDQLLLNTATELYFNPCWSPSGRSLTVYRQTIQQDQFANALLQISASGEVDRTLLDSNDLYLYTIAEPAPDGRRHLIGVSADASIWFLEALGGMFQEPGAVTTLPLEPPPTGYLYVLDQAGGKIVVAQPQRGTVDLVSRQSWSPDGAQVVFMRAPHPAAEGTVESGLGIYVGPPGQTRLLVPFSAAQQSFELTIAYPVWQPAPQGPLPTMVPLAPAGPEATAVPTPEPTTPVPTATPTATPPRSPSATPSPSPTPPPVVTPTPAAPAAPQSNLRTYLLIGIGLVVLVLVVVIAWMLLRPAGGTQPAPRSNFLTRLFQSRPSQGESPRNPFRPRLRRSRSSAETKPQASGGLLRRPAQPPSEPTPEKRSSLFSRRPKAAPETPTEPAAEPTPAPAKPKKRPSLFSRRPKAAPETPTEPAAEPTPAPAAPPAEEVPPEVDFPSLRTRRETPADWPDTDRGLGPDAPTEAPSGPPQPGPTTVPPPTRPASVEEEPPVTAPAPALSPEQELLRQGIAQVRAGQTVAGMATLQKVIQRAPEEGAAWLWLGWAAARQNQRVLAERCFVRAQELGLGEPAKQALAWLRGS
jgi:hypothetical protein